MRLAAFFFVALAIGRIVSTYHVFSQTADEPAHFAAGLEWLADARYTVEYQHPPLARIAVALLPYLDGTKPVRVASAWDSGNAAFAQRGYWRTLTLARLGTLPFFALACWILWLWTRDLYGDAAALVALGLFSFLPPALAHAGLATLDMAAAATALCAAYCWYRWLRSPTLLAASLLGVSVAAAVCSKFSALVFLPVLFGVIGAFQIRRDTLLDEPYPRKRAIRLLLLALFIAGACVVLLYRGCLHGFWEGIRQVAAHNRNGHDSWLLGEYRNSGWWYFFPVALAVKAPLGFLVLAGVGAWKARLPALCSLGILLVCMPVHINLGVRHVLIVYLLFAMMAGAGYKAFLDWPGNLRTDPSGNKFAVLLALCVFGMVGVPSLAAHPDYLAYFNEIPQHRNFTLAESDLDWGQDLQRLTVKLRELGLHCPDDGHCLVRKQLYLNYFGMADLSQFDLPPYQPLEAWKPVKGWIAVSIHVQTIENAAVKAQYHAPAGPLDWLDAYEPVAMAGKSIRIYHVE